MADRLRVGVVNRFGVLGGDMHKYRVGRELEHMGADWVPLELKKMSISVAGGVSVVRSNGTDLKTLGLDGVLWRISVVVGVDLVPRGDNWLVLEVNSSPGIEGLASRVAPRAIAQAAMKALSS